MGPCGLAHVRTLIRLANDGNSHAATWLRNIAQGEIEHGCSVPQELTEWLATPPYRRGRGKPKDAARAATATDATEREGMKAMAAWAAWWNVRAGMATSTKGDAGPAFDDVSDWLVREHRVHDASPSAVRTWYYERLDAMNAEHARIEALAAELN